MHVEIKVKPRKFELQSLIRNRFGTQWIKKIWTIYELVFITVYKIYVWVRKETSQ